MSTTRLTLAVLWAALGLAAAARADRTQVFSIQGGEDGGAGEKLKAEVRKVAGVKKADFDARKAELTVRLADGVADQAVIGAVEGAGLKAVVGAGQGAYRPAEAYPAGADVATLSKDGSAVGPLPKLRVPDKYTVFDVYADWCGPCKLVDQRLREIVAARKDVAVRKLNVVDFDTPLARELGPKLESLPYVIVYSPAGKKTEIEGTDFAKLDKALKGP
jgi:thiol-disulfide isomerase/thioredoxin